MEVNTPAGLLLGAHMSTAGSMAKAIERGSSVDCTAIQIFVKQNSRWAFPALTQIAADDFRRAMKASNIRACFAHAIYLVNVASNNPEFVRKSLEDLVDEIQRCEMMGVPDLVMHPGAHCGLGLECGIEMIAAALNTVFAATEKCRTRILLETTAGQGTCIGHDFQHLADIIARVEKTERVGVCLDTCHVFAAGHDIRTRQGYEAMWKQFDEVIGRDRLRAMHLNDSKKPLGSRVDRHDHIGKGLLGTEPFRFILNDQRLRGIPMVLETDKGPDLQEDRDNLQVLHSLIET